MTAAIGHNPELLREFIKYDPETGALTWKHRDRRHFESNRAFSSWNSRYAGKPALASNSHGYLYGRIFGQSQLAHRIAWVIYYGERPDVIDHVNGDRADNRIANLRNVQHRINLRNCKRSTANKSGATGVFWLSKRSKWQAGLKVNGQYIYLGLFESLDDAISARKEAEKNHGFHVTHGRAA